MDFPLSTDISSWELLDEMHMQEWSFVLSHDIMHKNLGAPRYDDGDRQGDDSGCISYQCLLGLH